MMNKTHHYLEKKLTWYRNWHHNGLSKFVHWFVLTTFVLAFLFNSFAAIFDLQKAKAASPWSIDTQAEWNTGSYTNTDATAGGNLELTSQPTWYNSTAPTFYDSAYTYRRKITFANSAYAENLTDFPVMLKLDNASLAWLGKIQSDLDDVIFKDADGSALKWEWEKKDAAGESIAWVKIPRIDASSSTDFIYMDYGNPSATDQSDAVNVWTNSFIGVWHLSEQNDGSASGANLYQDSSGHGNIGKDYVSDTDKTGKIGYAQKFDGSDYIEVLNNAIFNTSAMTGCAWVNLVEAYNYGEAYAKSRDSSYEDFGILTKSDGQWQAQLGADGTWRPALTTGQWSYLCFSTNGTTAYDYRDGASLGSRADSGTYNASFPLGIGATKYSGSWSRFLKGRVDELRFSSTNRSANWIAAEYKNQGLNEFTPIGAEGTLDGFGYRRTITFDNSAQAENLANFPVMVKANNTELNWSSIVQAGLNDVIFVDSDNTTKLNWEWEKKDSSGESIAWVKVPQINQLSSTDYIYMYYGSVTAADQSVVESIWDTNYHGIWHSNEANSTLYDATVNNINLTVLGNPLYGQTGKIDSCLKWTTTTDTRASITDTGMGYNYTVEAWVKPTTLTDAVSSILSHGASGGNTMFHLYAQASDGKPVCRHAINFSPWYTTLIGTNPLSTTEWTHLAASYNGTNLKLYVNGVLDVQVATSLYSYGIGVTLRMGGLYNDNWNGWIDEPRVSYVARSDKWIAAEYKNQGPNTFTTFGAPQNSDSYSYRRKITFNNSAQAEDLVNFPVVVKANDSSLAWSGKIQADMDDVIFVDANDTTPLSFEWETKAPSGDSIAWVKVPQINLSSSVDYIYMYYGNLTTTDHSHQKGVWSNGYAGVWHSNDATTSTIADSTANGNNGTKKAANEPIEADGKIGKAQSYDETNDYVNVGTAVSGLSDYTLTAWIKTSKTEDSTIIGNYDASYNYWMIIDNGGDIQLYSGTWLSGDNFKSITDNNWHFIVGSRSGTTGYLYIDGQLDKTGNVGSAITSSLNTYLGRNPGGTNPFGGIIDEMRISSSARSAPWIAAEYKNQTDIFNTIDSEKTPIETTGTYSSIAKDMAFNTNLTLFNTSQTLNGGTASYSIRTGPVSVPDGTWTGWVAVTPGADPSDTLDNNRYAQVKVDLTGTGSATPDINSFTLSYFSVPGTSVISTPADGSSFGAGDVAIAGTATSNSGASMVRVEVSTDGGTTWNNATGTDNWTYTFVSPPSGIYNIKSRVYNSDNVYETAGAGINITVDADQPTSAINYPVNGSGYYSPNLLVAGTSSDTGGGNVSKVEIKVTKGGTTIKDWTQATNTGTNFSTWSYSQNSILEDDQTYLIESRATDNFGNVQTTLGSSTITVDLTYPSSSVTSPKDGDKFKVEDRKIDGTATTNNGQALSKIEVRIMKLGDIAQKTTAETTGKIVVQDWTAGSGLESWSYIIPNSLFIIHGGGYYQIQSRATNIVSFVESPSPGITILVDDKPPTVPSNPILQDITNYSEGINALFLQFDVSKDNETLVKEYEISVNGKISKLQVQGVNEKQSSAEPISIVLTLDQGVKEGANSVSIKAKDEVDNTSDSSKTASVEIKKQSGNITDIEIKNITLVKKQGDDEKTSALVQYKTSIPASTIVYWDETNPEGSGAKAYSEPSLNYNHTAIVDNLTPDTNFKVKIEGIDEYGNQIESAVQSFKSTPKPEEESILRIIIKALEDLFSWAKKVMAAPFSEKKNLAEETKNYLSLKTIDTSEKLSADKTQTGTTKTSLVALSFRKGSVLVKENMSLTGNGLKNIFNTNLQSQVLKTNILDSNFGIALDKSPEPGKKVIYKLDKIDQSAKVLVPGAENQLVPEIKDIETKEIITTKEKAEYLVIFKTDIPAKAEILAGERKITEENNNLSHSFYLDSLNPGDTIKYKLTVLGPYGTTKESDEQSFTVPKPEQQKTIWQIIIDALISSFDWLKNILK